MKMRPITPNDYERLKPYFKNQSHRLCAYALPSCIAWSNENYQTYGLVVDDFLVLGMDFTHENEDRHIMLPISPKREFPPEMLLGIAKDLGFNQYYFVPEDYIDKYGEDNVKRYFTIKAHKKYDDYIYNRSDLAFLKGNKYSKKRNLINQFKKQYVNTGRVKVEKITHEMISRCLEFLEKWCEERDCGYDPKDDLACEKQAAINMIENIENFDVKSLLLRIDGEINAFGIGAHLTDDMAVLHSEKAFSKVKGLYQYFDNLCAIRLFEDYTYINKESDMNEEGLKKAKRSYYPCMFVKSYKLILQ